MKAIQYIGKEVEVKVERTIGSSHLEYPETIYPINYGFVPKTMSGDGEELDCYILGEDKLVKQYRGKCIAVIHRLEEDDDKLIIAPNNKNFTNEEIKQLTYFQERYFKSIVIR